MKISKEVKNIVETLEQAGFEAFIVGGCVRDSLRGVKPNDWDIATNAKPEQTAALFDRVFEVEKFGLVTVLTGSQDPTLREVEIMPYRTESKYTDKRHPDRVEWAETIEQDLSRRDFTVNAMAARIYLKKPEVEITDPFGGQQDLKERIVRAVGNPEKRFSEDGLRLMRAVRFAVSLGAGWKIEEQTKQAVKNNASLLEIISKERVKDEFLKIIMCPRAADGIELLRETNLLGYIIPELLENVGVEQNKHHIYTCYEHAVRSLDYAAKKGYSQNVRLAALLHDIAKPRVKEGEGRDSTFYNHEVVGARMTEEILRRLKFPSKDVKKVVKLVRYHLFYYDVGEVTESSVRRLVRNVGRENMKELLQVRYADRIGSGCPKARPYKLRHLQYVAEKISKDPISVEMLEVGGDEVMSILNIEPSPPVGRVLDILLAEVLDDPKRNSKKYLKKKMRELKKTSDEELKEEARRARESIKDVRMKKDDMLKNKYWLH